MVLVDVTVFLDAWCFSGGSAHGFGWALALVFGILGGFSVLLLVAVANQKTGGNAILRLVCFRGPGSFVRLQLDNLGMKWPRYDTNVSFDDRNMNFETTCLDDVKNMMMWSREKFWKGIRTDFVRKKCVARAAKVVKTKNGRRSTNTWLLHGYGMELRRPKFNTRWIGYVTKVQLTGYTNAKHTHKHRV